MTTPAKLKLTIYQGVTFRKRQGGGADLCAAGGQRLQHRQHVGFDLWQREHEHDADDLEASAQDRPPVWFAHIKPPRKNRTNAIQRVCHVRLQTTTRTG